MITQPIKSNIAFFVRDGFVVERDPLRTAFMTADCPRTVLMNADQETDAQQFLGRRSKGYNENGPKGRGPDAGYLPFPFTLLLIVES